MTLATSVPSAAAVEAAAAARARRLLGEQVPLAQVGRRVEPDCVVDRRRLQRWLGPRHAVRQQSRVEQRHVAGVGEQATGERRLAGQRRGQRRGQPEPVVGDRLRLARLERMSRLDRAELERPFARRPQAAPRFGSRCGTGAEQRLLGLQQRRCGDARHRRRMVEAVLDDLERCRESKDRPAVLDRLDPPRREAGAVALARHLIDDRSARVAGAQEIGVQRMRQPVGADGARCRGQRLGDDLPAENARPARIGRPAAEQVDLDRLEVEQGT